MSNRGDQNGCQPPLPAQPRPPSESQTETEKEQTSDQPKQICRNYVWGTCSKNAKCKFRHELDVEEMKKILKFCHDYQNRTGCTREDCTYLHTTREEENLFLTTGQIPRVLAERHAAMSASANVETIPQIAMFIRDSYATPTPMPTSASLVPAPLPPPVPPPPSSRPAPPAPPPIPAIPMMPVMPSIPIQRPPPPPPPPPTVPSATVTRTTAPVYTAPPPPPQTTPMVFPMDQPPPPLPVMFDASKPPPPLPTLVLSKSGAVKHKSPNSSEAGPSKIRKPEDSNVADAHCENCVQREIRINLCRQEMDKLLSEEEYKTLLYKKKLEEYETGKNILKSLVSPELFGILEEYIEGVPQIQINNVLSQLNQTPFTSTASTTRRSNETFLQALSALNRRSNQPSSSDVLQSLIGILRNSNTSSDKPHSSNLSSEISRISSLTKGNNTAANGFSSYVNGQKANSFPTVSMAGTVPYSSTNVAARTYSAVNVITSTTSGSQITAPSAPYTSYQISIPPPPPPPRTYYNQSHTASSCTQNISYNTINRARAPVTQPTPPRTSTSAAIPIHHGSQNCNQYVMGRYPPPNYYSPYQ
ncbi:unnamed protein product [Parnassius mnemosyne]|uniref:C3H1-type domain-containing protein n=1 Tax=Parnassius mnemosyne TaxID=213953 RepID=A0AAV1L2S6_9NEOP